MTKATITRESIYMRGWLQFENISWLSTGLGMWQRASRHAEGVASDPCILIHRQQKKRVRDTWWGLLKPQSPP